MAGRRLLGLGGASLLAILFSLPEGAPMPPPPYEMYDIWWKGGAASSCQYYYKENFRDFFLNCSVTATKGEASIKHNQPRVWSTASPSMIYTKCHKGSRDCETKDICLSAYTSTPPNNRTVKNTGCLEDLHVDYLIAEFAITRLAAWRAVISRGEDGADMHKICTSPMVYWVPNSKFTRCVKVRGSDLDLENLVMAFGNNLGHFETSLFYTKVESGMHYPCFLNATDISTSTPFCNPRGFHSAQKPRLAASGPGSGQILMVMENEICVIANNLTGKWECSQLHPGQGPADEVHEMTRWEDNAKSLQWVVKSTTKDGIMQFCNTSLPAGSSPVTCRPYGGPKTPKGRTTSLASTGVYLGYSGALIESEEGMVLCVGQGSNSIAGPTCYKPLGMPASNLGAVFPWIFQSIDPHTGGLSMCGYSAWAKPPTPPISCTAIYAEFEKISPFKGWLEGSQP